MRMLFYNLCNYLKSEKLKRSEHVRRRHPRGILVAAAKSFPLHGGAIVLAIQSVLEPRYVRAFARAKVLCQLGRASEEGGVMYMRPDERRVASHAKKLNQRNGVR